MTDIKPEPAAGEILPSKEKILAGSENLKQKSENMAEGQKSDNFEAVRNNVINEIERIENAASAADRAAIITMPAVKRQKQVENILAEDLTDLYLGLTPQKRQEFKKVGEETAGKISRLLAKAKINIGEIIKLIKKWLYLIPGINKYFLEQEAKIKADELIKLKSYNDK